MRCRLFVAVVVLAALLIGTPGSASTAHVLRFNYDEDGVSTLNPILSTDAPMAPLMELTSAEFVRFDSAGTPVPELVTQIPSKENHGVSADGRTITWHLRHGVRWSDGAPFTADDVLYTVRVAKDPSNNIPARAPWDRLAGATAPDPYTVVFRFKAPYALFLADYFTTLSTSCVLPKHVLGPGTTINDAAYNALPVGIGPFRYTAFHRGDDVEMEANPYYWRGRPKLAQIVYKLITDENTDFTELQTGELDLWTLINGPLAQRAKAIPGKAFVAPPGTFLTGIYFNVQRPAVADPRVRRALRLATDRAAIVQKIALGNGLVQESVVPAVTGGYFALRTDPYDPRAAVALLDAAGWKRGADGMRRKNGIPLTVELAIPAGYEPSASTANLLHDDWGAIGVGLTIHVWSDDEYFAPAAAGGVLQSGKFDAAIFSHGPGPPYANLTQDYGCADFPPNGFNIDRYCNRAVDAANDRYEQSFDAAERARLAATSQRMIDADAPAIVLYLRIALSAFDDRLRGYHPSAYTAWGDPLQLDL